MSLGAFAALGGSQAAAAEASLRSIRYVVTDRRYKPSLEFGAALADRDADRLEVTSGLTRLWSEALVPLWEEGSQAVAGLTRPETWAGIAEQARSAGRRSVLVCNHVYVEGGEGPAHSVTLPGPSPDIASALARCGDAWPRAMADIAARYPVGVGQTARIRHHSPARAATVSVALTSWIIA